MQVKCVSFLTWLLRMYPAAIITHRAAVTDALVHLLRTAPDVVSVRKELLVAMRNTLTLQQVRECVAHAPFHSGASAMLVLMFGSSVWPVPSPLLPCVSKMVRT